MSKFSGKTDLYDCIMIHDSFAAFKKRFPYIYIGHGNSPLQYKTISDLLKYFPYIPWFINSDHKHRGIIRLSEESYVDSAERDGTISKEDADNYRKLLQNEITEAANDATEEASRTRENQGGN